MKLNGCWLAKGIIKKQSQINRNGLFSNFPISKGSPIVIFSGELLCNSDLHFIPESIREFNIQVNDYVVLLTKSRDLDDSNFINHSCDPNCGFHGQILLIALRDIESGEEITFDYAMCCSDTIAETLNMACNCGSQECRRIITGNDWKIPELQKKYLGKFAQYIQDKIS